jgi:hypothetical protein
MKSNDIITIILDYSHMFILIELLTLLKHIWLISNHCISNPVNIIQIEKNIFKRIGPNFSDNK